jgi:hypothetical protein
MNTLKSSPVKRILIVATIIAAAAGFVIEQVTIGSPLFWALSTAALAAPVLFLVVVLADVLSIGWRRGERGLRPTGTTASSRRPRFTMLQLMVAIAIVTVMCWFAAMLGPIWWGAFHQPTYAELAARLRDDSAQWERLATENPSLGKEYRRLAEKSRRAADRLDRRTREIPP